MSKLKSFGIVIVVFLVVASASLVSLLFYYYGRGGTVYSIEEIGGNERGAYAPPSFSALEVKSYASEFSPEVKAPQVKAEENKAEEKGAAVIFDAAHKNSYTKDEISALLRELGRKGVSFEFLTSKNELGSALKYATALVVISPTEEYEKGEMDEVKNFAAKGGKVLLIADPTRKGSISGINSISSHLGMTFEQDYLYNLQENAGNFRYIIIKNFERNEITSGLNSLVFYVSCSISSNYSAAFGDENTKSSSRLEKKLSPLSFVPDSSLALCDQSFMQAYYSSAQDNAKLISNIADFLAKSKRTFTLEDFPYIFVEKKVKISYLNDTFLEKALKLKNILKAYEIEAELEKKLDEDGENTIFLGLYADLNATQVKLSIFENEKIKLNDLELNKSLVSIIYAVNTKLWMLGNSEEEIDELLDIMEKGEIDNYLLTKTAAAVLHKPKIEKTVEAPREPREENETKSEALL